MLQDICQSILTHTHTHPLHTHTLACMHIYILYIYCTCFLCTLTFLHTLCDSNLAEWQLLALFLPDFTCLFNKLFSFSLFPSALLCVAVLFCFVLFCSVLPLYSFCSCIRSATKVLKQFLSQDFVSSNCLLFASNLQQVPASPRHPLHTPWHPLAGRKVFCVQIAVCLLRTAWNIINAKAGGRGMQNG